MCTDEKKPLPFRTIMRKSHGFQIRGIASIHSDPEFVRDMGVPDKRDPNCRGQLDMHTCNIFTHFSFELTESGLHPDRSSSQVANILLTNK